jgi:hypothetical protein
MGGREMSDTPETDALISVGLENADRECVPAEFGRKIERERDEARTESDILKLNAQREAEHHDRMVGELEKVYKERDEARAVAGEMADIASKYLSFLLAVTPTKANEQHEKDTMRVIAALKRWKKL